MPVTDKLDRLKRSLKFDWPLHFSLFLTNWLPDNVAFLRLRGWLVSHFLGSCGRNLRLGRNITFYNPAQISIGSNVYIAYGCWLMAGEQISIANNVIFGPYCIVVSSNHSRSERSFRYGTPVLEPIHIGYGTWIAAHVTLTAGTNIGKGTLIAANSVVRGEIPDNVLVAGQPARIVKYFED